MSEDNLEPLVTQCPNCDTRFRVTEVQLQIAAGRVRCGACLSVFDGTQHLSVDGEPLAAEGSPDVDALLDELDEVRSREPEVAPAMPVIDEDELIPVSAADLAVAGEAEEAVPDELLALEAQLMQDLRGETSAIEQPDESFDELAEPLEEPFAIEVPEVLKDPADAPDAAAGSEEPEAPVEPVEPVEPEAPSAGVEQPALAAESNEEDADSDPARDAIADTPGEWLDEVAEDVWTDSRGDEGEIAAPAAEADADLAATAELAEQPQDAPAAPAAAQPAANNLGEVIELQALPGADAIDDGPAALEGGAVPTAAATSPPLFDLEEEEAAPQRRSWLTLAFALLALIALPAQVLWFQYEAWVMNADYRPIYQTLCNVAGCELPPMRDVSKIASKRSFIRAHPERSDARIVDVLMVNNADFAQPYPLIELMATSLRGQLIAGRRFRPEEYLQGDAQAGDLLPPRTPVHVSLEIADPAQEALNFEVTFR